jgi:hypothetical protein
MKNLSMLLVFVVLSIQTTMAQTMPDTAKVVQHVVLKFKDGTKLKGVLLLNDGKNYAIQTDNLGVVNIPVENVLMVEHLDKKPEVSKEEWFVPLRNTNYLVNQSAFSTDKGELRYINLAVFSSSISYGFSDQLSGSAGFVTFYPTVLNVGLKYSVAASKNAHFAIAGNTFIYTANTNTTVKTLSVLGTFGTSNKNLTIGGTWVFAGQDDFGNNPLITVSGITRLSKGIALMTDNVLTTSKRATYDYLSSTGMVNTNTKTVIDGGISYGVRFLWPTTLLDLGMFRAIYDFGTTAFPLGIPYAKLSIRLNRKQ